MRDFSQRATEIQKEMSVVQQLLSNLAAKVGNFSKITVSATDDGVARFALDRVSDYWHGFRGYREQMRAAERRLTMLGYDTEVAVSRSYFDELLTSLVVPPWLA